MLRQAGDAMIRANVSPPQQRIMVVEDNPMVRRSIEATLRGLGYDVLSTASAEECIESVRQSASGIDLLITDVVLPRMSGRQLIDRLQAFLPELPVLFMSGYDRLAFGRQDPVPAEHFLQKPFDCEELSAAVARAMAGNAKR
jgi:two-component system cell cycle sensor histidine kinase/response regulator CckA